jgi:hypothetical protein
MAWDRFAYTHNNPLRYTDPTGHVLDAGGDTFGWGNTKRITVSPPVDLGYTPFQESNYRDEDEGEAVYPEEEIGEPKVYFSGFLIEPPNLPHTIDDEYISPYDIQLDSSSTLAGIMAAVDLVNSGYELYHSFTSDYSNVPPDVIFLLVYSTYENNIYTLDYFAISASTSDLVCTSVEIRTPYSTYQYPLVVNSNSSEVIELGITVEPPPLWTIPHPTTVSIVVYNGTEYVGYNVFTIP